VLVDVAIPLLEPVQMLFDALEVRVFCSKSLEDEGLVKVVDIPALLELVDSAL